MREQIRDSTPRRSSPSREREGDGNESSMVKRRDVSSRSPFQNDEVSRRFKVQRTDWEQDDDGIQRDCGYSSPYEVEMQIRDRRAEEEEDEERDDEQIRYRKHSHLRKDAFSGKHYPNRSDSSEIVIRSAAEQYWRRDAEPSRSTMRKCLSDEPKSSRFITSCDYKYSPSQGRRRNVVRNNETDRLESNSRNYDDSSRRKGYNEDGRDKETSISSPLSQVGSSGADLQEESSRCCIRVNDSDRVDETRLDYDGNRCAPQVLQTRHLDDCVGGNSSREQQGKSIRDFDYSCGLSRGDHGSPAMSRCGKEMADESRKSYQLGSDIAVREFPSVGHDVKNMDRETDLLMQPRGSLSESYVRGSRIVDVDADNTHFEFCRKERMSDQYDSMKEHYPFAELGSSVVNERDDKTYHNQNVCYEQRKVGSLDNKCQLLRKDYQYDGVDSRMYPDRDDRALQSEKLRLYKEREACLDYEGKAVYADGKRRELRNEYHFGNDGRMHSDVHGADIVVDRDGRVVQLRQVCLNKGKETCLDNGREDVYLHHKSQQLKKDYDSGTDNRIYPDVNRSDIVVDREDARGLRYRGVLLNDRKEAYLQCESQQFLKDHEDSYAMMHPDLNKSDNVVDREDDRGLRYRRVYLNDRKEAYLQCESQQLPKNHEIEEYAKKMHPNVNRSDIQVDREDVRALKRRGVSFNDGNVSYLDNERRYAYLRYENQQLKKGYKYGNDDRIYRDVNKSDILVNREDSRSLELRGVCFDDGKESYLDNERRDAYLRYESQQVKKDYDYGIDRDVNSSYVTVDHGNARALELRNEAYLGNGSNDVYCHYKIRQLKKDYDSSIEARMYPDINRSEIVVVDQEAARDLELNRVILNDGREAYMHYENNQLLKDHDIDAYEMMHRPNVSRSSARKQDEEALRCKRYHFDERNQVYVDDERLQQHSMRYQDGSRQEVYHSNDEMLLTRDEYGLRSGVRGEAGEVIHENMAEDYNYSEVKQLRMSYEKPDDGRFRNREAAYEYDRRDKLVNYEVEGGTSRGQFQRPRISAKERLGGRVKDSHADDVMYRELHQVRNPKRKGKSHNRNQRNIS